MQKIMFVLFIALGLCFLSFTQADAVFQILPAADGSYKAYYGWVGDGSSPSCLAYDYPVTENIITGISIGSWRGGRTLPWGGGTAISENISTGIVEFDLSGASGLLGRDNFKAELTLTMKSADYDYGTVSCLSAYDIQDAYENGIIELMDASASSPVAAVCTNIGIGTQVVFDMTAAVRHDLFDSDQSAFSGFYIQYENYCGVPITLYDHTDSVNAPVLNLSETTIVRLSSFAAAPKSGRIVVMWETESELDNAGFNIYRAESENGEYFKINDALIPAQGSPTQGAAYQFTDDNVRNRKTYFYKLEDVDVNGVSTMHGPVSATPRLLHGLSNQ